MKIQKYNESVDSDNKANRFAELSSKFFFSDLSEFDKISISDNGEQGEYIFHIRFKSVGEKSFDKLKIFYKFVGFQTSEICLESQLYDDLIYRVEEVFNLLNYYIEKLLVKLEELETEKKYNL